MRRLCVMYQVMYYYPNFTTDRVNCISHRTRKCHCCVANSDKSDVAGALYPAPASLREAVEGKEGSGRILLLGVFSESTPVRREERGEITFTLSVQYPYAENTRFYEEMITCHFRMLLQLKRENISNFGNSYPTPATACNLGSHILPQSSATRLFGGTAVF